MLKAWDLISTVALIVLAAIVFACLPAGGPEQAAQAEPVRMTAPAR
ncbi:MAG: hypothetical protein BWY87_00032 [Deltaproteobacteria bacterium ADurb.Bin510]|jgi:hypothetical protein|nr:MAG: hypothetical protein BWY87_00032 [Deltaproteobacteria bacterium ADurb.Bin510]